MPEANVALRPGGDVVIAIPSTAAVIQTGAAIEATRRRSQPAAQKRAAALEAVLKSPKFELALRRRAALLLRVLVDRRAIRCLQLLYVVIVFVVTFSVLAVLIPHQHQTLKTILITSGIILELVFVVIAVSTRFERSRAFLARMFGLEASGDNASAEGQSRAHRGTRRQPPRPPVTFIDTPLGLTTTESLRAPHEENEKNC
ncbi:hypothetical protein HPB50_011922 [Hyalomma asiaticum]|uniref:Uncharacterized protein n=1 Tax=Hyalomma asiaticum TaxID=266040 RepID=A0ACB7SUQ2_HYAAI|nr:hypothetical protein HPB50_011922 [Hyalomma asiaticum]